MRVWHISDTHCLHEQLIVPKDIDIVIHSGDATNLRDPLMNKDEIVKFLTWYGSLSIPNKIFVPGNHDTSIEKGNVSRSFVESLGIKLLINESTEVCGLKIWGSPYTPRCGLWSFMTARGTINRIWEKIPEGLDILVTHGPPKSVLDATYNRENLVELVGDGALFKQVSKKKPRYMMFGHVHSTDDIRNAGTRVVNGLETFFSNGSCCDDGKFLAPTSNGNVIVVNPIESFDAKNL